VQTIKRRSLLASHLDKNNTTEKKESRFFQAYAPILRLLLAAFWVLSYPPHMQCNAFSSRDRCRL